MVEKEDLPVIEKLINSMEETVVHLEEAHKKQDKIKFNDSKKLLIEFQQKIQEMLK